MSSIRVLEEVSEKFNLNWNAESMLEIACLYIDNQVDEGTFMEFVDDIGFEERSPEYDEGREYDDDDEEEEE